MLGCLFGCWIGNRMLGVLSMLLDPGTGCFGQTLDSVTMTRVLWVRIVLCRVLGMGIGCWATSRDLGPGIGC